MPKQADDGTSVGKVYAAEVIGRVPKGVILIDCSMIDVDTARDVISAAELAGYDMVDAPVSGGIAAAAAGTLTFMVGGSDTASARAQPILAAMEAAKSSGSAVPVGQHAKEIYEAFAQGNAGLDFSAIIKTL